MPGGGRGHEPSMRSVLRRSGLVLGLGALALSACKNLNSVGGATGGSTTALQDEIFHLHILSTDGVQGRGVLSYARDCLGLTSVLE